MSLYGYSNGTIWTGSTSPISATTLTALASYFGGGAFVYQGISKTNSVGFLIDINGSKGPNVNGQDVFWFTFYGSGNSDTTPAGVTTMNASNGKFVPNCYSTSKEELKRFCKDSGSCCAALIMQDGWRVSDDYPWN